MENLIDQLGYVLALLLIIFLILLVLAAIGWLIMEVKDYMKWGR